MKTAKFILLYATTLFLLLACGGGGESLSRDDTVDDDDQITEEVLSIALSVVNGQGDPANLVSDGSPLTINATVTDSLGAPVVNKVVSFVLSQADLASFNNDTGTALTNAQGVASIQLTVGSLSGSGTLTATVEESVSVSTGFQSAGLQQENPFALELFASSLQLASSGGDEIELIAVVKNEQNILLAGVPISFSAIENASLTIIDSETQVDGTARARLSTQNNQENRTIIVSASTAALTEIVEVKVEGTEVNINGADSVVINDSSPITIVLSDSDGNGIANKEVTVTSEIGEFYLEPRENGLSDEVSVTTGVNGQVTVDYVSSQAGVDTIEVTALSMTETLTVTVQQDDFSFTDLPEDDLLVNTDHALNLKWFKNGQAFAGGDIVVTTSRGIINSGNNVVSTDASGLASVTISSSFAGPASISAVGTDNNGEEVTARAQVEFYATTVDRIFVDATPDLIGPEAQTSTITATVRDEVGNLVKGKTVNFRLVADSSGGSISPNTAKTDSNGIASTVYTSNAVSGDNGVTIGAMSGGIENTVDLSVGNRAFDIVVGTGNEINADSSTIYIKEFAVFVTDASGRPVSNAALSASVVPTSTNTFRKGTWAWDDENDIYVPIFMDTCASEDINKDGLLDVGEDLNSNQILDMGEDSNNDGLLDIGEDINGDGLLTPGNVATVNFKENISRTDDFGQANLEVRYPKQYAIWSKVRLTVSGQSSGTESRTVQEFVLPINTEELTTQTVRPSDSPFGIEVGCDNTL